MRRISFIGMLITAAIGFAAPSFAVDYEVVDLGTLGGRCSWAYDVNDKGQVVGYSLLANNESSAFLWQNGAMQDLHIVKSQAHGINSLGQIIGVSFASGIQRAFILDGNTLNDLGDLGGGLSDATAINDAGQVVGASYLSNGDYHAFRWQGGKMTDLGTVSGGNSFANDINESGLVVGQSGDSQPCIWLGSGAEAVGDPFTDWGEATSVNDKGQVVCRWGTRSYAWQASNEMRQIGQGDSQLAAVDINNSGQIVGYCQTDTSTTAFLWQNGSMCYLDTLGGSFGEAQAISDTGLIAGIASDADGNQHAVLWQPVPEPSSLLALFGGILGASTMIRRRRM